VVLKCRIRRRWCSITKTQYSFRNVNVGGRQQGDVLCGVADGELQAYRRTPDELALIHQREPGESTVRD
jgi:hypothetical protein